jgi:hypothetical protein
VVNVKANVTAGPLSSRVSGQIFGQNRFQIQPDAYCEVADVVVYRFKVHCTYSSQILPQGLELQLLISQTQPVHLYLAVGSRR